MKHSKLQRIKYASDSRAYVTHYGKRLYIDDFIRIPDADGLRGVMSVGAFAAYMIKVTAGGETARVWYEVA